MSDTSYSWDNTNAKAIMSLRMALAHRLEKEQGLTRSRASIAASDEIARDLMNPPGTGQELDKWLATYMQQVRADRESQLSNGHHRSLDTQDSLLTPSVEFSIPTNLTPPDKKPNSPTGAKWETVVTVARNAKIGEWVPMLFKQADDARLLSSVLSYHVRTHNDSWKIRTRTDKENPLLVWIIKEQK